MSLGYMLVGFFFGIAAVLLPAAGFIALEMRRARSPRHDRDSGLADH